jgi:hypothetical protein
LDFKVANRIQVPWCITYEIQATWCISTTSNLLDVLSTASMLFGANVDNRIVIFRVVT